MVVGLRVGRGWGTGVGSERGGEGVWVGTGTQASCTTTHPKPSMVVIVTMLVEIVKMPMQFVMKGKCEDRTEISRASRMPSGDARLQVMGAGCWVLARFAPLRRASCPHRARQAG